MNFLRKSPPTDSIEGLRKTIGTIEVKLAAAEVDAELMRVDLKALAAQRLADGSLRGAREDLHAVEAEVADMRLALESARTQLHRAEQNLAAEALAAQWKETEALFEKRTASIVHLEELTKQLAESFINASTLTAQVLASLPVPCRLPDQFGDVGLRSQIELLLGRLTLGGLGRPMIADPVYLDRQPSMSELAQGDVNELLANRSNRHAKPSSTNGGQAA